MRTLIPLLLVLGACAKPASGPSAPPPVPPPHDLACPEGSVPLGAAPPRGLEAWCARTLPDGKRLRTGPSMTWHAEGVKASEGHYYDDGRRGEWRTWHTNGRLATVEFWRDGVQHGTSVTYDPAGNRRAEGSYLEGLQDGPWTWWFADGKVERTGSYVRGEKDGEWLENYPSGHPKSRRVFRAGRQLQQQAFPDKPTTIEVSKPPSGG